MITKNVKHIYGDGTEIAYARLIADEGKALTDGTNEWNCVDVLAEDAEKWGEIDNEDVTDTDYLNALAELGVQ